MDITNNPMVTTTAKNAETRPITIGKGKGVDLLGSPGDGSSALSAVSTFSELIGKLPRTQQVDGFQVDLGSNALKPQLPLLHQLLSADR